MAMASKEKPKDMEDVSDRYITAPRENGDALSNREAQPGSAEYHYLHRYDSPDNERDSMG